MKVYMLRPEMMQILDSKEKVFLKNIFEIVNRYTNVEIVNDDFGLKRIISEIDGASIILFFNNGRKLSKGQSDFLQKASNAGAQMWPIAMNADVRLPDGIVKSKQSYDVPVCLENRVLGEQRIKPIAQILARKIVSECCPTCYKENMYIFVSHRRLDGEKITAKLCDKIMLLEKRNRMFRDVVEVKVGLEAQDVVDEALYESGAFIFLHTPLSAKSDWVKKELSNALLYDIPIIWVRIDESDIKELPVMPGEKPHLECKSSDFNKKEKLEEIVNQLEEIVFQVTMSHSEKMYDCINSFEEWANNKNVKFELVDKTRQIYHLKYHEDVKNKYPHRDYVQYVQYFSRKIKEEDVHALQKYVSEERNEKSDRDYDSIVLLSNGAKEQRIDKDIFINGYETHDVWWQRMIGEYMSRLNKKIVIAGALPETKREVYKITVLEAVKIFAQEIIKNGYTLVFGSHPTFQKNIFFVAEAYSDEPKEVLEMYVSKYFSDKYDMQEFKGYATVHEIEASENREKSLARMRKEMLNSENICAMICIGGKKPEESGIDEEIRLARERNIPVFLIGTVGGRTEELAANYAKAGNWSEMNNAGKVFNEELFQSVDFRKIANMIFQEIK